MTCDTRVSALGQSEGKSAEPTTPAIGEVLDLVDRAIYDLEHGWPEAAFDALGRAREIFHRISDGPARALLAGYSGPSHGAGTSFRIQATRAREELT